MKDRYLNEREVAELTGFAIQTLRNHRHNGLGIPYIKATSRAVRYFEPDVYEYMESRKIVPENN